MTVKLSNMYATFADASIDYTGIVLNVTYTSAGSNSTLLDLKVNGNSMFSVNASGGATSQDSISAANSVVANLISANVVNATTLNVATINAGSLGITSLNANSIVIGAGAPASATDVGSPGQIKWDAGFIYVCVAGNTWVRAALSTWP